MTSTLRTLLDRVEKGEGDRVLFLDIDGVLNDEGVFRDRRFGPFPINHVSVLRLHEVVRQTGCQIVLSSAWRGMTILERKLDADFVFEPYTHDGCASARHEDGSTIRMHERRGHEVAEWLSRHPEVTTYAIVDDESDFLPEQMPHLVQTDIKDGLTQEKADALVALLRAKIAQEERT